MTAAHVDSPPRGAFATPRPQCADAVLMVRPANFGWNAQTQQSNRFQRDEQALAADAAARARVEFDGLVEALRRAGVEVLVADDRAEPVCPDAVFPNNWTSLHTDGTVVLYPMLAPSRRLERRREVIERIAHASARRIARVVDLTHYERQDQFLEGTGSIVFDHVARVAYAARSPRTHDEPLAELCRALGYEPCVFDAHDADGVAIYHTNVMLSIGSGYVVVAATSIDAADRARVLERLRASGRDVVEIDHAAVTRFAGNVLELRAAGGARVLVMSMAAAAGFGDETLARLRLRVDGIVTVPIPTIEALGGGSVRCMLAEVFLPRVAPTARA